MHLRMEFFNKFVDELLDRLHHMINSDFERVTYTAVEILKKADKDFQFPVEWGIDLQTEHENLTEEVFKKAIFVIRLSEEIKAFYMKTQRRRQDCCGLRPSRAGVGEIIGGSQRERLDILEARMDEIGMNRGFTLVR